jgi:hypothetical protein
LEHVVLPFAVYGQRLHHLADDAGQVALEVRGMLALDRLIGDEGEVVADEDARSEADTDWKTLVVAVSEADRVGIAGVWTAQLQQAELPRPVFGYAVVFGDDFMSVHSHGCNDEVTNAKMRDRHMA